MLGGTEMKIPTCLIRTEWPPSSADLMPGHPRFDALLASIRKDGIREPLTINLAWLVIDGNHRLAVSRYLGIDTVDVRVWTGTEYVL
mgnify:CR=1 FL=1